MTNLNMFKWRNKDGEVKIFRLKKRIFHKWRDVGDLVAPFEQLEVSIIIIIPHDEKPGW